MKNKRSKTNRFATWMQKKLLVTFFLVFLAFIGLSYQLIRITQGSGEQYKKQVLSQQRYDSMVIPYKRGEILDSRGTVLAVSEKVYNVILDAKALLEKEEYLEPTLEALRVQFGFDIAAIRTYLQENPSSQYYVLARRLSYEEIAGFADLQADEENNDNLQGIWFEEEYKRYYPNGALASDVIGFTTSDNNGLYGLERYYNDVLAGVAGREYGYLNEDAELERTTIAAVDGSNIVTTIDANIQGIVEKHLLEFNEEYQNNYRQGNGAHNVGCVIMEVNTGEILAMGSYPNYDLNDIRNPEALIGMPMVDIQGRFIDTEGNTVPSASYATYINEENLAAMDETTLANHYNSLWKNFCISDTYEPGSVVKPFTVATGLESGRITGNEQYECLGYLDVGDYKIRCHNTRGDGVLTVQQGVERSCNVCMMYVAAAIGRDIFVDFQQIFNFGLKTNIDLEGEARTVGLVYDKDNMRSVELATCSFGQGFNVTMIQVITGFCSMINGGNYYEPHVVGKITSPTGATIQNIEPRLLKQTVSPQTSATILEYCNLTVSGADGTGKTARPAGYMIGGKTGTAETVPRDKENYVVSFMGYAPADDPQIAIYVVVDRPNAKYQDDAKFATLIVRGILTEVLPYLKIYMTEELTDEERAELEALQLEILTPVIPEGEEQEDAATDPNSPGSSDNPENSGNPADPNDTGDIAAENGGPSDPNTADPDEIWKTFPIDPESGYAIDPDTGEKVDPDTGAVIGSGFEMEGGSVLPPVGAADTDIPY